MKNLVRDIQENCPQCNCDTEETVKYLFNHGDISATSEYYREIWFFYQEALKMFKGEPKWKKKAKELTLEHFKINRSTFFNIRKRILR